MSKRTIFAAAIWILLYAVSRGALEKYTFDAWFEIAIAVAPVIPFAFFLFYMIKGISEMDELQRLVQLKALGIAFPLAMLLVMLLGSLELVIPLSADNWSYRHVWQYFPLFYFFGLAISWKRYQ
jgi:hypothetical protein